MAKDPTSTTVLRRTFSAQFARRYTYIQRLCLESIVKNDCFGLKASDRDLLAAVLDFTKGHSGIPRQNPIPTQSFAFRTDPSKIQGFLEWFQNVTRNVVQAPAGLGDPSVRHWYDLYIKTSYAKGMKWARGNLKRDKEVFNSLSDSVKTDLKTDEFSIRAKLAGPESVENLETLYLRAFTDLEGISAADGAAISRILANGLSAGWNPNRLAKEIYNSIEKIGKQRSRLLARTEIIRAHHKAAIQEYRDAELEGVVVEAEWATAGDDRVCPRCKPLNGKFFSLNEIENLIPLHPLCRCAALPVARLPKE